MLDNIYIYILIKKSNKKKMEKNKGKFTKLIDEICNDNDYLFAFQVQEETKILVRELIKLRDGELDNIEGVLQALNSHIQILNIHIKHAKETSEYNWNVSYLEDVLYGLEESKKRLDSFDSSNPDNIAITNLSNISIDK